MMTGDDVKLIIAETLAEQKRLHNSEADEVVLRTIATILTSFGIEEDDRVELRRDFEHLWRWRKSVEQAQGYTFKAIVTAIVGGLIGLVWMGFKVIIGRP